MELPLQITARDFELSDAIRADITEKAEKLDKFYPRIVRCRVVLECPKRHQHEGKLYNIHIYITVPKGEIPVKRVENEDLYVAIRDAFQAARRKLEDFGRSQRGDVKKHEEQPHARVSSLFPEEGYGFITTPDGLEIYFHENSLLNKDFKRLKVGTEVRYVEKAGDKGPHASSVTVVGSA